MAGGPIELIPDSLPNTEGAFWIGVDRGISTLLARDIHPSIVFGDFDSVAKDDLHKIKKENIEIYTYPPEKDDTDLGLAVEWALEQKPDHIHIYGSTGGRFDHMMGAIQLLLANRTLSGKSKVTIYDRSNVIYAVLPGNYSILQDDKYTYTSFFPISSEVKGITLLGFKYPLNKKDILLGSTLCVSNELISNIGTFSFDYGILLVVRSSDHRAF